MLCNTCGVDSGEGVAFCKHCGVPLVAEPAVPEAPIETAPPVEPEVPAVGEEPIVATHAATRVFCARCGAENVPGFRFCNKCGSPAEQPGGFAPVAPIAPVPAGAGLIGYLKSKAAAAALVGAVAGLAFILIAAVMVRPMYTRLGDTSQLGSVTAAQLQSIQSVTDKVVSVPFLATNLHLGSSTIKMGFEYSGSKIDASMVLQSPPTKWSGLGALALLIAAFLSVFLAKPVNARDAVLQGVVTCVPYALGIAVIAAVAATPVTLDLASLGLPATAGLSSKIDLAYSFSYLPIVAFILIAGSAIGALVGLIYIAVSTHRPFGDVVRGSAIPFAGPVAATFVALGVAMLLTFPATAAIWAHLKSEIPPAVVPAAQTSQYTAVLDDAVLTASPTLALYAYSFGHGVPLTASAKGSITGAGSPGSIDGVAQASIFGVSGQEKNLGTMPNAPKYEWWVYLLPLLPVIPLLVGGYLSAAWSRGAGSPVLEGAKMAIPYALAMLGLAWVSTLSLSMDASLSGLGSGTFSLAFGPDLLFTGALALAWAATLGALGGLIRQRRARA